MTGVEILLLVIGVVFFIASFFITEKLGPGELNKIGELSNEEIKKVIERELLKASSVIEDKVGEKTEDAFLRTERSMERECNEKIREISEYSDTVIESMNKTHNEIMFLYSMLNDKHVELTDFSSRLQGLASDLKKQDEEITDHLNRQAVFEERKEEQISLVREEKKEEAFFPEENDANMDFGDVRHNDAILALHKNGKTALDIARELGLGLGEVQLVIGLYEGKKKK